MDHKTFLASLPAVEKTRLTALSNSRGLAHLAGHLAAILTSGSLIAVGIPGWPLLLPLHGISLVFLFALEHECTHRTPFATAALNDWVGRACGAVLVLPFEWFRYFHLAHHRWTNLPGLDPELDGPKPETRSQWLVHVSGLTYWLAMARITLSLALGRGEARYLPVSALPRIRTEARWLLALYIVATASLFVTPLLFWIWVLPVLLGQPFLRLYLLAEHGDCPAVANMLQNSRTTFTTGLVRFFAWNMPYHAEHHSYPSVPFHQLPALHHALKDHLEMTAPGYVAFTKDYLARRRA